MGELNTLWVTFWVPKNQLWIVSLLWQRAQRKWQSSGETMMERLTSFLFKPIPHTRNGIIEAESRISRQLLPSQSWHLLFCNNEHNTDQHYSLARLGRSFRRFESENFSLSFSSISRRRMANSFLFQLFKSWIFFSINTRCEKLKVEAGKYLLCFVSSFKYRRGFEPFPLANSQSS